jgi:glycosyltransferase involved in cell wall biosynthesis
VRERNLVNILLLHGWLLERSGSNVYTASLAREWVRAGHNVQLFCQERHPDRYPFIDKSFVYDLSGEPLETPLSQGEGPGTCILHRPEIGDLLPVFNLDEYEGFSVVKRFVDMTEEEVETYLNLCVQALERVVRDHPVDVAFANHTVPNPTLLARLKAKTGIPFVVFPHGSAIEYAVKKNDYIKKLADQAIEACDRLIVGNQIVTDRIWKVFPDRKAAWQNKHAIVSVGVDTGLFRPVPFEGRRDSIQELVALGNPGDGKSSEQTRGLCEKAAPLRTDAEILELVRDSRGQYHYTSPDADLPQKLEEVDWDKEKILLYVGKLIAGKGVHDLFLALPELLKKEPNLRIVVVGESTYREPLELLLYALSEGNSFLLESILRQGWALDEREQKALASGQAYVEKIGLETLMAWGRETRPIDRVLFTGYLKHARFSRIIPCADVTIFPSEIAEAYPLVLLESICAGVTPMGAYFEGLKDGVDSISEGLDEDIRECMRLRVGVDEKVSQIVEKLPVLLAKAPGLSAQWRARVGDYSWSTVAGRLADVMGEVVGVGQGS